MNATDIDHLAHLCVAAQLVLADGITYARQDDPHRIASLPAAFDGKALPRLAIDYLADGQIRVTHLLVGTKAGEDVVMQVFSTLLQGPPPMAAH